ncbi:glycosyltransferase family 9 protein [Emticicia sp. TH156]|uniref:glycosyltransferase family 9 protein n=1 Tax=Emticicia sp. TH156 TaxID=2067454 RepID=UPI000C78EC8E|nr:glycosyltransferase family 9 protein [Emticicia sp. TH156]PLK43788.1 ADP-heptose--LPS heptosyltransferase [Emticicia sp. TH156]
MQKFIALWQHRYRKYTHLFLVYWHFFRVWFRLMLLKAGFAGKKKVVAIILTQQFGDIVAGEPISRQVRQKHPGDYLIWIVKPMFRELLENNPNLDDILEEFCANQRRLLINSGIFDTIYNLQFRNNSYCPVCQVYVENPEADAKDITIHNYYFLGNLLSVQQKMAGLAVEDMQPRLFLTNKHKARVDQLQLPQKFLVIHAQSAQNSRNWNNKKWDALINYIIESTDFHVIEIGLSSDLKINSPRFVNLCGRLTILETAEVISRAVFFIGIDSGPAHLANAVGTPGLIMIGKLENFVNHIPYSGKYKMGENVLIVRNTNGPSADIEVETVIMAITENKLLILA